MWDTYSCRLLYTYMADLKLSLIYYYCLFPPIDSAGFNETNSKRKARNRSILQCMIAGNNAFLN